MVNKYAAAEGFLDLLKKYPEDFKASSDSGRDHNSFFVTHIACGVSIGIETINGIHVTEPKYGNYIKYVSEPVLRELYQFAISFINNEKLMQEVQKDNLVINELIEFYAEK